MKDIVVIGAGGMGREVMWLIERLNAVKPTWNILGYIDDCPSVQNLTFNNYPVLGSCDSISKFKDTYFICAIGASAVRKQVVNKIKTLCPDVKFATLIDPDVKCSNFVNIGEGSIICAESVITVNITIGEHCLINLDCMIGHDAVLRDFATLYPSVNISGNTEIGECTEIGAGSVIIQSCNIGNNSIVGAGAVVVRNIPENCTAVGCPAKPIKFRQ